jgi:GT2 family glycosyltransferase
VIDLIVVNYHTEKDLEEFLLSVPGACSLRGATLTVIDVETGQARTRSFPAGMGGKAPIVGRWIEVVDNIGYGRACNLGASTGVNEVIAFFNADVVLSEESIDRCFWALRGHSTWGVLGPRQVDDKGAIVHAGIFGTNVEPRHRGWKAKDVGQFEDVEEAVTVSGSAYFIKRRVWDQLTNCKLYKDAAPDSIGAFLPTPHYYEETWCSYHARAHEWQVMYYGPVTMTHKWHRASPVGGWAERQMAVSQRTFREVCDAHGIARD